MVEGEEKTVSGPLGLWKFPMINKAVSAEQEKIGEEGFLSRTMERAPNLIIANAGKTAGAIAGSAANEAVTGGLTGGVLPKLRGLLRG